MKGSIYTLAQGDIIGVARGIAAKVCLRYRRMDLFDDVVQEVVLDMLTRDKAGKKHIVHAYTGRVAFRRLVPVHMIKGVLYHDIAQRNYSLDDPNHRPTAFQHHIPAEAFIAVTRLQAILPSMNSSDRTVLIDCVDGVPQHRTQRLRARVLLNRIGRLSATHGAEQVCTKCGRTFLPSIKERRHNNGCGRIGYASCAQCRIKIYRSKNEACHAKR